MASALPASVWPLRGRCRSAKHGTRAPVPHSRMPAKRPYWGARRPTSAVRGRGVRTPDGALHTGPGSCECPCGQEGC